MNRRELRKLVSVTGRKDDKPLCDAAKLTGNPEAFAEACKIMGSLCAKLGPYDLIVSPSELGAVFGAAMAATYKRGFVLATRAEELAANRKTFLTEVRRSYDEAKHRWKDTDVFCIPLSAIRQGQRVLVVDDVLASGLTTLTLASMTQKLGGDVIGIVTLAELTSREGRRLLEQSGWEVRSVLHYS